MKFLFEDEEVAIEVNNGDIFSFKGNVEDVLRVESEFLKDKESSTHPFQHDRRIRVYVLESSGANGEDYYDSINLGLLKDDYKKINRKENYVRRLGG